VEATRLHSGEQSTGVFGVALTVGPLSTRSLAIFEYSGPPSRLSAQSFSLCLNHLVSPAYISLTETSLS
jgi:hypothetical protein